MSSRLLGTSTLLQDHSMCSASHCIVYISAHHGRGRMIRQGMSSHAVDFLFLLTVTSGAGSV